MIPGKTKEGQYKINHLKMKRKLIKDENALLLEQNKTIILNGIFNCQNPIQVDSAIGFARYLRYVGLRRDNYLLFLKLLESNNKWVIDALLGKKTPRLLFTSIRPNYYLIRKAFLLLSAWHPKEIYTKALQAVLGIIAYSYYKPDDGYRIRPLRINDLNNLGKHLDENSNQDEPENRIILDILDRVTRLGEYKNDQDKNIISKHAFNIRIAFMDNTKRLLDVIPDLLLIDINREISEVKPSEEYLSIVEQLI